ncbi:suppressor of fused domain protein [Micromonospora purpureochromogenes]|uniref:suppressor of fused domain protein n=1 Tax=Micromonospora purpureochromogenes TaxID=47872 RepID=UPI0033E977CA
MDEASGAGLLRHEPRYDGFVAARGQRQEVAEAIDQHIATHFGPVAFVLHEVASHLVGVHVYVVGPTAERPYQTLLTSGMSERPMTLPPGHDISPYAELMLCLPADWPLTEAALRDERTGWPIRVLKQVARLPHEYGTWIGEWHSVPNGDPPLPYAPSTAFAGVVVTPMLNVPPQARTIDVAGGTRINLLALVPLHPAEVVLKVSRGTDALIAALDRGRVSELLDPARPPLV